MELAALVRPRLPNHSTRRPHGQGEEGGPHTLARGGTHSGRRARVVCKAPEWPDAPLDVHHLLNRHLWPDGNGYELGNGATLCPEHHEAAEQTTLTVEAIRAAAEMGFLQNAPRRQNKRYRVRRDVLDGLWPKSLALIKRLTKCTVRLWMRTAMRHSMGSGGPTSCMPCACHSAGSCGGIAFALVTSRKNASIWPAGWKVIRIRPREAPTEAHTCGACS